MPIAEAIYFAVTNSIMKGIVGNSCMAVASIHGQVFDQSPGQNKKIFCMWRSRSDNFILKPARKDTLI